MTNDYRILHRRQDLGLRLSIIHREQPIAIGILDMGSTEELKSTLDWYIENMNLCLHVMTTEERFEKENFSSLYPDVTFIIFNAPKSTGRYINVFADECYSVFFLVTRTDTEIVAYEGDKLLAIMNDKAHPAMITPVLLGAGAEVQKTLMAPYISGREVTPKAFAPDISSEKMQDNLYPMMMLGLYDRALFQRLRGFDTEIYGEYYQALDFGCRVNLFGYKIETTKLLAMIFPRRSSVIENRSECEGMNRFYTKALSIRRIAGKSIVTKWKPYCDKQLYSSEVKKQQAFLQKTDFFTLEENWPIKG